MTNHQLDQREKELLKAALHQTATDAERYRKLRAWLRGNGRGLSPWGDQGSASIANFDKGVDALPEPPR